MVHFPQMEHKFSELRESDKSLKHELGQFKDTLCYLFLAGCVVTSWSFRFEQSFQFYKYVLSLNSMKTLLTLRENSIARIVKT